MRYFKLLVGAHQGPGKVNYQAVEERDDKGNVTKQVLPIVPSEKDLVKLFGSNKFIEVPRDEVPATLLRDAEKKASEDKPDPAGETSDAASSPEEPDGDDIQAAAEQGAKDITPLNHGKDVTEGFTVAVNASLRVYMKPGGKYTVTDPDDNNKVLTAGGPIKKDKVVDFIEAYLET